MGSLVLDRKRYWIWVAVLLALELAGIAAMQRPALLWLLSWLHPVVMVLLAGAVAARFADFGWSRWLGFALVLAAWLLLPVMLAFLFPPASGPVTSPLEGESDYGWVATLVLILLLLVAGLPRSAAAREHVVAPAPPPGIA